MLNQPIKQPVGFQGLDETPKPTKWPNWNCWHSRIQYVKMHIYIRTYRHTDAHYTEVLSIVTTVSLETVIFAEVIKLMMLKMFTGYWRYYKGDVSFHPLLNNPTTIFIFFFLSFSSPPPSSSPPPHFLQ